MTQDAGPPISHAQPRFAQSINQRFPRLRGSKSAQVCGVAAKPEPHDPTIAGAESEVARR